MSSKTGKTCVNGCAMDPSWDHCPYCAAEESSAQQSAVNVAAGKPTIDVHAAEPAGHSARRTIVGDPPSPSNGRETLSPPTDQIPGTSGGNAPVDTRKIVGVLVTYSWVEGGKIFPVRQGKNFIGQDQSCDVVISQDGQMSGTHALILCRSGKNELIDQQSTNGTFLNGEILSSNHSVDLENYAEIKTGSTLWTFVKIEN